MSGWIKLERGWLKSNDFAKEPFTEREAWLWLIESAAWEPHTRYVNGQAIELKRGDILVSQRTFAEELGWGRQRVRGFIAKLELLKSISQNSTHGLTLISLTNYAKYQDQQPTKQPSSNPAATQQQPIKEEDKEDKEDKDTPATPLADGVEGSPPEQLNLDGIDSKPAYRFVGTHLKITEADFQNWKSKYHGIPDFEATLFSVDQWVATLAPKARSNPYGAVHSRLLNAHNDWLRKTAANPKPRSAQPTAFQMPC